MTPLAPHITAFFQERLPVERRASAHTSESYAYAFKLLLEYASERLRVPPSALHLEQIDAPLVVTFLNHLEGTRANRPSSRNVRLAAIKSFMHFLEFREPAAIDQIRRILAIPPKKADTRLVRHLTVEEMHAILNAPEPSGWDGLRDRAMLHLCFAGGLRVSELTKYVQRASKNCPSLSAKHVSPHVLRHTCALTVLQATKDLRKVSLWLGHAHMQTTEMYTRADPSVKLEALEAMIAPKLRSGRFKATDKLIASLTSRSVMRSTGPRK